MAGACTRIGSLICNYADPFHINNNRGWTVSYEEGLQKVFYKENMIAQIYAMADWYSPADVEAPTIEGVQFSERNTGKGFPFTEVPDVIFSEIMRDVDLVVSVAHVGGVDPEASLSTVEMRAAIMTELVRLFKLTNVELKGSHALISGMFGNTLSILAVEWSIKWRVAL